MAHREWLAMTSGALLSAGSVWAQPPTGDEPEEVIVRGRRLADFRAEVEAAQIRVYELFNDLNSGDAFDVHCQTEDSTGTRMRQQTCRPQFVNDISTDAAEAWVNGLEERAARKG